MIKLKINKLKDSEQIENKSNYGKGISNQGIFPEYIDILYGS